jgi:hypothetical protein
LYEVRDIRDELHMLRRVFETQAEVVDKFSKIFWPEPSEDKDEDTLKRFRDAFKRDCGLENLIERVKSMDEDAKTIKEGVSLTAKEKAISITKLLTPNLNSLSFL